jgi:penicillin-binding protein 1B
MSRVSKQNVKVKRKSWWRRIFTPRLIFFLGILVLACTGVFAYYYVIFSEMIDNKLHGNIFIRSTGIYTAPRKLYAGQTLKKSDLLAYLDRLGYLNSAQDSQRSYYLQQSNAVEIVPSPSAAIDGQMEFSRLRLKFSDDGNRLSNILQVNNKETVTEALLEPELLTAINNEHEKRKIVEYKDLPEQLVKAIVAIEDRRFFDHSGIDFRGLFRAIWRNLSEGELQQGGSTITQQLVKNFFLTPERTLKRKLSEAFIAILLETRMTKTEIFQMYCNEIYLGQDGSYSINGFGEAANFYFNKDIGQLDLPEAAFLAGIIRGPGYYSPFQHRDRAVERRNQVLDSMVIAQFLPVITAENTKKIPLKISNKSSSSNAEAPYFLDFLQTQVNEQLGEEVLKQQSYRIYSTIDMELQRFADKAVREGLARLEKDYKRIKPGSLQAGLVALNAQTGEILAMVGGRDYSTNQFNRATAARRQPGSVFKPIVYTAAIHTYSEEKGDKVLTPASKFLDAKEVFNYGNGQTYEPDNYGMSYSEREVTLREALTKSLNVVTVKVAEKVGYTRVAQMAERLGLPRPQPLPSVALGTAEATPLEIARAYTTYPNLGKRIEPRAIRRVTDSDGKTIHQSVVQSQQVISPQVAAIMTSIMQDVMNRGTAARARSLGFNSLAAGKTGTSRDGWFAGFTPNLVCVVYVGFDDNAQLGLEGSKSALPIWTEFMKKALQRYPELGGNEFQQPKTGLTTLTLDRNSGLIATESCNSDTYQEHFITGTEIHDTCNGTELPILGLPSEDDNTDPTATDPDIDDVEAELPQPARPRRAAPIAEAIRERIQSRKELQRALRDLQQLRENNRELR